MLSLHKEGVLNPESVSVTPLTVLGCALLGGVCVAECLTGPLCVTALVRKPEEKEPGYLWSLPALPHTLSVAEEKGHSAGPGMGRESPFHTGLVGNFSSILCMPFAYDPFFSQRSL